MEELKENTDTVNVINTVNTSAENLIQEEPPVSLIQSDVSIPDNNDKSDNDDETHGHHKKAEGTFVGDELEPYNEDSEGGDGTIEAPPQPETIEEEFPEEIENLRSYKIKFPLVTEMLYGIKICNTSTDEQAKIIEKKLVVGVGITICRNLMAETGRYGENVMSAKKESYRGIFQMIMILIGRSEEYDEQGNILSLNIIDDESLKELVIADRFVNKTMPILSVFNKDNFNEKQLDNAIDFCMARLNEVDSMLVSENYTEQIDEVVWGLIIKEMDDRKNYKITYYKNDWNLAIKDGKRVTSKVTDRTNAITVSKGNLEYSIGLNDMGDKFYGFVWSLIFNYLNNTTQKLEEQTFKYKLKKNLILEASTSVFSAYLLDVEKQFD
jgi:hypothetical protein